MTEQPYQEVDPLAGLQDGPWLDAYEPPPMRWAVPGLVPEGLTLLAGPPKAGKSWLVLDLSLAVASGGVALGNQPVEKGSVLYLALEDGNRRMKQRSGSVFGREPLPAEFRYDTRLLHGVVLTDYITAYIERFSDVRLVCVDTLGKVRPRPVPGQDRYEADYRLLGSLQEFAYNHGVAILVCHHTRKASGEDFVDEVSGTNGLTGAADVVMVLRRARGQAEAVLHVTSRDYEEREVALTRYGPCWQMYDGPVVDANLGDRMAAVVALVNESPEAVTPQQAADALGVSAKLAAVYLGRAEKAGMVRKPSRGLYVPVGSVGSVVSEEHLDLVPPNNPNTSNTPLREDSR